MCDRGIIAERVRGAARVYDCVRPAQIGNIGGTGYRGRSYASKVRQVVIGRTNVA